MKSHSLSPRDLECLSLRHPRRYRHRYRRQYALFFPFLPIAIIITHKITPRIRISRVNHNIQVEFLFESN